MSKVIQFVALTRILARDDTARLELCIRETVAKFGEQRFAQSLVEAQVDLAKRAA